MLLLLSSLAFITADIPQLMQLWNDLGPDGAMRAVLDEINTVEDDAAQASMFKFLKIVHLHRVISKQGYEPLAVIETMINAEASVILTHEYASTSSK